MNPDSCGRTFQKLRISLTGDCNYRCYYCTPRSNADLPPEMCEREDEVTKSLSADDFFKLTMLIHKASPLSSVRLTGGEPLLYKGAERLIYLLKQSGIPRVAITTNGSLLTGRIASLRDAGLDSINLSLDAIDPEIFKNITFNGKVEDVIQSIDACLESRIRIKLNAAIIRGMNESQILPLIHFAIERGIVIRFIELMEMGHLKGKVQDHIFKADEIIQEAKKEFSVKHLPRPSHSTTELYEIPGRGRFGIISNVSRPFCNDCDRLRMNSSGYLFGCISSTEKFSMKEYLEKEAAGDEVRELLEKCISFKNKIFTGSYTSMKSLGG